MIRYKVECWLTRTGRFFDNEYLLSQGLCNKEKFNKESPREKMTTGQENRLHNTIVSDETRGSCL